jgi:hypothetical protein
MTLQKTASFRDWRWLLLFLTFFPFFVLASDGPGGGPPEPTVSIDPGDVITVVGFQGDAVIDVDGDGKFDTLEVRVEVTTNRGGEYTHSAQILDDANNDIEFAGQKDLKLSPGKNIVSMRFDGKKIAATRKTGPFLVRNYSIYLSANHHFMAHTTDEYKTRVFPDSVFAPSDELSLLARSPNESQRDVPISSPIHLVFSEPLDEQTLNSETISLRTVKGIVVPAAFSYHPETRAVDIYPTAPLEPNQGYLVMVSNKIRSREGNPLMRFYAWSFVTSSHEDQ